MKLLYLVHVLATVVWVGGMFFAHQCLRPVVRAQLEGPQRLRLWNGVFGRFFPWVWLSGSSAPRERPRAHLRFGASGRCQCRAPDDGIGT